MDQIRPLLPQDAEACDAIIHGLPEFFGVPSGVSACADAVRNEDGWAAESEGRVIGFATWTRRTTETADVTWMAVERERRHARLGTRLLDTLIDDLRARGFEMALVMTSAAPAAGSATPDTYAPTRAFWISRGFTPLIEMDIWETNIALLLVRPLNQQRG